jgi:hypothetical protein
MSTSKITAHMLEKILPIPLPVFLTTFSAPVSGLLAALAAAEIVLRKLFILSVCSNEFYALFIQASFTI